MRYLEQHLQQHPIQAPETLCYCPTTHFRDAILSQWRKQTGEKTSAKTYLGATTLCKLAPNFWILGPGIGGPAACLFCEPFLHCGSHNLLFFGSCASLSAQQLAIGDICTANAYIGTENIAQHYNVSKPLRKNQAQSLLTLATKLEAAKPSNIWSTDVPNLESPEKSAIMRNAGAHAVEMETAALAALTSNYGCCFSPYLVVTDVLEDTWKRGFSSPTVIQAINKVSQAIVESFVWYNHFGKISSAFQNCF